jgi:uncharacterized protein YuzE
VDFDEGGNVVGIEIWRASKNAAESIAERSVEEVRRSLEIAPSSKRA